MLETDQPVVGMYNTREKKPLLDIALIEYAKPDQMINPFSKIYK